jgi:carbonic anhydrase
MSDTSATHQSISALEALERLREGNARFASGLRSIEALATAADRKRLVQAQRPFAVVLSCSDSRVPSEIVFDCGLGDLFVVRVAGNIAAPSLVGSVEFAASTFGTRLVVVLGHTHCGAVAATIDALTKSTAPPSANIRGIVDRIAPAVTELVARERDADALMAAAVRANVRATAEHLRRGSQILEALHQDGLIVVGAEYSLDTGVVDFFDVPSMARDGHQ